MWLPRRAVPIPVRSKVLFPAFRSKSRLKPQRISEVTLLIIAANHIVACIWYYIGVSFDGVSVDDAPTPGCTDGSALSPVTSRPRESVLIRSSTNSFTMRQESPRQRSATTLFNQPSCEFMATQVAPHSWIRGMGTRLFLEPQTTHGCVSMRILSTSEDGRRLGMVSGSACESSPQKSLEPKYGHNNAAYFG